MAVSYKDEDGIMIEHDTGMRHEYFDCICDSDEHILRFSYFVDKLEQMDTDDDWQELFVSVQLSPTESWYGRIWPAIKFIFGHQSRFGHWGNWAMKRKDAERLKLLLDRYIDLGRIVCEKERTIDVLEQHDDHIVLPSGMKIYFQEDKDE